MGTCWNCNSQLTLREEETRCDNCQTILFYQCNDCKEEFRIVDKKTKKRLKECSLCGYFKCPECSVCSWACKRYHWEREILRTLKPEITQAQFPNLASKVRLIVTYLESEKTAPDRRVCSKRAVPISYAKGRIKYLLAKLNGHHIKSPEEVEIFNSRLNEIKQIPIGSVKTITKARELGSYGQEYRDAFNLSVCLGLVRIEKRLNKEGNEYDCFIRYDGEKCPHLREKLVILKKCIKCKKKFNEVETTCPECNIELVKVTENIDSCQLYRGSFIEKKKGSKLEDGGKNTSRN